MSIDRLIKLYNSERKRWDLVIINLKKLMIKVSILFLYILLTLFIYIMISKLLAIISPQFQYKKPNGNVVQVDMPIKDSSRMNIRLLNYYWREGE